MGVEQHLVRLQQVGPHNEGAAVAELGVGHLQLGALAGDDGPVFAPVELERFTGAKGQGYESAPPVVRSASCRLACQTRAKAATRLYEPS